MIFEEIVLHNFGIYQGKHIVNLDPKSKTKPVVLYCKSGGRSSKCAEKMAGAGFVKIYDLEGGISEWRHKGFEIKTKS